MKFDLAFQLVDLPETGNASWYNAAASMMLDSARHAFARHDVRYVQLTDAASKIVDGVDVRFIPAPKIEREELMQYRGHCTAEWALHTDRPVVFCDVDLLWNNDSIVHLMQPFNERGNEIPGDESAAIHAPMDIMLFQRALNNFQPFNGGLIVSQPEQTEFWETYRSMMKVLPNDVRGWWGDQIALGVMVGIPNKQGGLHKFGSRIGWLPIDLVAPSPKAMPTRILETAAIHLKGGKRKSWLPEYYSMLNQSWSARAAAE